VQKTGIVENGRPLEAIAGHKYPHNDTTLYVLVDAENHNAITDAQRKAIADLLRSIEAHFPKVQIVKV
jgi:hypothetical protein